MASYPDGSDADADEDAHSFTYEEQESVFDRQVRIWGREAQQRLSNARVVVLGLTPSVAEAAKGLALAGVCAISVADDLPASSAPPSLLQASSSGSRASAFARAISDSSAFCHVHAVSCSHATSLLRSGQCNLALLSWRFRDASADARSNSIPCYVSGGMPFFGAFFFVDDADPASLSLMEQLRLSRLPLDTPPLIAAAVSIARTKLGMQHPQVNSRNSLDKADFNVIAENVTDAEDCGESPPTASVVGGVLGQEATKMLSGSGKLLRNAFAFDERTSCGALTHMTQKEDQET